MHSSSARGLAGNPRRLPLPIRVVCRKACERIQVRSTRYDRKTHEKLQVRETIHSTIVTIHPSVARRLARFTVRTMRALHGAVSEAARTGEDCPHPRQPKKRPFPLRARDFFHNRDRDSSPLFDGYQHRISDCGLPHGGAARRL